MSESTSKRGPVAMAPVFATLIMVILAIGGIFLGTVLGTRLDIPMPVLASVLCFGATGIVVLVAFRQGQRAAADCALFFLSETDRLFFLDAMSLGRFTSGPVGYAGGMAQVQRRLDELLEDGGIPSLALEICTVEKLLPRRNCHVLVCTVRDIYGRHHRQSITIYPSMEAQDSLLRELERRRLTAVPELRESPLPMRILLSALAFGGSCVLALMSHVRFALLDGRIYYPSLAAAMVCLWLLLFFCFQAYRGE